MRLYRIAAILLLLSTCVFAQNRRGEKEFVLWTAGGHGTTGTASGTGIWNAGLSLGYVVCNPHGPGFLRGSLEGQVDVLPIYIVVQDSPVYGGGYNLIAKWNFAAPKRVHPWFELGGGNLFTTSEVPKGTSAVNFTPQAGFGLRIPKGVWSFTTSLKYIHISSAGLARPNPGVNTVQASVGLSLIWR